MIWSITYPSLKFKYQKTSKYWFWQEEEVVTFWRHNVHNNLITEKSLALLEVSNGQLRSDCQSIQAPMDELLENVETSPRFLIFEADIEDKLD